MSPTMKAMKRIKENERERERTKDGRKRKKGKELFSYYMVALERNRDNNMIQWMSVYACALSFHSSISQSDFALCLSFKPPYPTYWDITSTPGVLGKSRAERENWTHFMSSTRRALVSQGLGI